MIELYEIFILNFRHRSNLIFEMPNNYVLRVDTIIKHCISRYLSIGVGGSCKGIPVVCKARGQRPSKPRNCANQGRKSADD